MRVRTLIAVVISAVALTSPVVTARAFPSVLMFHGGTLKQPVFATPRSVPEAEAHVGFWCGRSSAVSDRMLTERPFVNIAVFWIPWSRVDTADEVKALTATLKPEQANQHGRIYSARDGVGAAAVTSDFPRGSSRSATNEVVFNPQQVPMRAADYVYGCWLTDDEIETARKIGVALR